MCRKWSSALINQFLIIPPAQLQPALTSSPTYEEYESSPKRFRGFCKKCGSSLIWRSDEDGSTWDVFIGTLDEKWLVSEKEGAEGDAEVVEMIARPSGTQYWMEVSMMEAYGRFVGVWTYDRFADITSLKQNAIPGVTDTVRGGELYLTEK